MRNLLPGEVRKGHMDKLGAELGVDPRFEDLQVHAASIAAMMRRLS